MLPAFTFVLVFMASPFLCDSVISLPSPLALINSISCCQPSRSSWSSWLLALCWSRNNFMLRFAVVRRVLSPLWPRLCDPKTPGGNASRYRVTMTMGMCLPEQQEPAFTLVLVFMDALLSLRFAVAYDLE